MSTNVVRTICFDCHSKCGVLVHVEDNKIVKIEGDPNHPVSRGAVCCKAMSAGQIHEHPDRLKYPLRRVGPRGSGQWEAISWKEAMDEVAAKCQEITDKYGPNSFIIGQGTGRGSNHFHVRTMGSMGQPGWGMVPTHVCLMPNLLPSVFTYGFFCAVDAADVRNANTNVEWGTNPFTAWPGSQGTQILEAKARGAKMIVIDPRFTDVSAKADIWLQLKPGSDGALALGLMNVIINEGLYDKDFVENWTIGFEELKELVQQYPPSKTEEITWVPAEKIIAAARLMANNRPTSFTVSLGAAMHPNGMQNGRAVSCLFGLLGDLDAKGGTLVNKFWDVMLDPKITMLTNPEECSTLAGDDYKPFLTRGGQTPWPKAVWDAIRSGNPYPIKAFVTMANDPPMCYENTADVVDAITHLDYFVVKDYFETPIAKWADLLLPTAHWTERDSQLDEEIYSEPCPVTIPQKCVEPPGEAKCDWQFMLDLGKRIKPEWWPWETPQEMFVWRAKEFNGIEDSFEEMKEKGYYILSGGDKRVYRKFEKGLERPDGEKGFRTASGKVEFYSEGWASYGYDPLPTYEDPPIYANESMAAEYPLILTTGGRLYPFYHSAWTNIPMQRELEPDPYIEINPEAAKPRGISDGDWVVVKSPNGRRVKAKALVTKGIDPRVAHMPRPGWKHDCKELGQPGYGYDQANPNILIPYDPSDPSFGTPPMRSWRCEITKVEVQ